MATTTTTNYALSKFGDGDTGWGGTENASMDTIDAELAKPRPIWVAPTVGATTTLDLGAARRFAFTNSQTTTIAFSNIPSATFWTTIYITITNGSAFVITWPAAVVWVANRPPKFKTAGVDIVRLETRDAGTTWYGSLLADLRNIQVLDQATTLQTSNTGDTSLRQYVLPASTLDVNGRNVVIKAFAHATTQNCSVNVKFGATIIGAGATTITAGNNWSATFTVMRTGAATQTIVSTEINNATPNQVVSTANETLSGTVTIDWRGSVTAGGTLTYYLTQVECGVGA